MRDKSEFWGAVLGMLLVIVFVVIWFHNEGKKVLKIDQAFDQGQITVEHNTIKLGEIGHPLQIEPREDLVKAPTVTDHPRQFAVKNCQGFPLPPETKILYAATPFISPEMVNIQMPEQNSGHVNICVPPGVEVTIIVWIGK